MEIISCRFLPCRDFIRYYQKTVVDEIQESTRPKRREF
jgi:hypothetical protein